MHTPQATIDAEDALIRRARPYAPPAPLQGPLSVEMGFILPAPKGWPRWRLDLIDTWPHIVGGDVDNYAKLGLDALTRSKQWWLDDCQVVRLLAWKRYGAVPGYEISVEEMPMPTREGRPRAAVASPTAKRATSIVVDYRTPWSADGPDPRCPQESNTQPGRPVRQCELVAGHHGRCRWPK